MNTFPSGSRIAFFVFRETGARCLDSRQALLMKEVKDKAMRNPHLDTLPEEEEEEEETEGAAWTTSSKTRASLRKRKWDAGTEGLKGRKGRKVDKAFLSRRAWRKKRDERGEPGGGEGGRDGHFIS
ncbi:hypothetical protein NSK_002045 [Nannochloropsis salina CCMP1776]|uniref:Uncharacterized protein n=1 Tax=Nannochloropsis salina CCMP1776 TaxID=1027361 RepID=A0A4D9DE30_9STRA|nr:hypothetical protein NSK_002045 [Nannochloropsis salina CCMP1776]|eukprot:TFJ86958.1 hypothetical protein NSK_002045 [Nannochloropsis salina CCMP1776]